MLLLYVWLDALCCGNYVVAVDQRDGRLQGLSRSLSFSSTTWLPAGADCIALPLHSSLRSSSGGCTTASSPTRRGCVETI